MPVGTTNNIPMEILFSGVAGYDTSSSIMIRVRWDVAKTLTSPCKTSSTIVSSDDTATVVQWKPDANCKVPMVTVNKQTYLLPISGYYPDKQTLADVSDDTLQNTLKSAMILKSDYTMASLPVRNFFHDVQDVLDIRKSKFSLPITHVKIPTKATFLPNSARPYRAETTDAIHHGFDFYVNKGTPVLAIEDGIIIHVKRDFSWKEMDHLLPGHSDLEEQENLDVYRGNTVYLKTLSGDVAIYAHLENIPDNINAGTVVTRGEVVGHVGDSAVPDKRYYYHLHFELALNPHKDESAGTYHFTDVLLWPFWGKDKTVDWMRKNDAGLFE